MTLSTLFHLLLALLLVGAAPVWAEDEDPSAVKDLKKLVEQQGEEIRRLQGEMGKLKAAPQRTELENEVEDYLDATDDEPMRGVAGGWSRDEDMASNRLRLGGYFSLEFRDDGAGKNPEFDFHRFILKLQADIADGISFDTEIEFEGGGADVSFLDDNEIFIEYAELRYAIWKEFVAFDVGVILIPWGRFNFYHDDPYQDLTDRPLVSRYVGAVAFGQPGVAVDGVVPFANGWFFDYKVAFVQGFGEEFTTKDGSRSARQSFRSDNNHNKQVFGRFVFSPPVHFVDNLEFGASATWGKWDDNDDNADYGWGVELHFKKGPWEFTGEYMWMSIEQDAGTDVSAPRRMDGWYAEVAYHFFPASWRGKHALFTDESTFTLIIRAEAIDLNHRTTGTTFRDDLFRFTVGFNFRPVERNVFKISYAWQDTDDPSVGSGDANQFVISWATYF
ncbi:MAG: porin [Planctomycetota bacterium]|jgi:hypothetical protein